MKNLLLIPLFLLMTLSLNNSCKASSGTALSELPATADSVIFTIDQPNYKATLWKINYKATKGSAKGNTLFQRFGSLEYIISQLYKNHPVLFKNNPYKRQQYKISITWSGKTDFKGARKKVLQKMQKVLNYTIKTDTVNQTFYHLLVENYSKLEKVESLKPPIAIGYFQSKVSKRIWDVTATLPKFAAFLSKELNWHIQTNSRDDRLYHIKLMNVQRGEKALMNQLKQKYGLVLKSSSRPVQRIKITFDKK